MANPWFQFKQFTVWHNKCAMKVGTDGVLLGAWVDTDHCQNILDVGTGTGLIALMMAQRTNAQIDAIDIERSAFIQASENVSVSVFRDQIQVYHSSLEDYAEKTNKKYDLIVSNPPYFNQSLKGPDQQRNLARHTDTLPLGELIEKSLRLMKPTGRMAFILPAQNDPELEMIRKEHGLNLTKRLEVLPTPDAKPKRMLVEFSFNQDRLVEIDQLIIETGRHQYTPEYIELTRDYYLKM